MRTHHLAAIALLALICATAPAHAADCRDISPAAEHSKLQSYLASHGFSHSQQAFLLNGADRRIRELPPSRLNANGAYCGIKAARAQVLGRLNSMLQSTALPKDGMSGQALWGKADVSRHEALVMGLFHACCGGALQAMFRWKETLSLPDSMGYIAAEQPSATRRKSPCMKKWKSGFPPKTNALSTLLSASATFSRTFSMFKA